MKALLMLLWFSGCAPTLAGHIHNRTGEPIVSSEARVNVSHLESKNTYLLTVDNQGKFKLTQKLAPGNYLIEALVPGYSIESQKILISPEHKIPTINLKLSPLAKLKTPTTSANFDAPEGRGAGGASLTPPAF